MAIAERYWKRKTTAEVLHAAWKAQRRAQIYQEQCRALLEVAGKKLPQELAGLYRRIADLEQPNFPQLVKR